MNKLKLVGVVFAGVVLALSGCTSGAGSDNSASGEQASDTTEVLTNYFNAFATDNASAMEPMLDNAAPNSPAHLYAEHQINYALAAEAANQPDSPSTVTVSGNEVTLVNDLPEDTTDQERQEATTIYKDIQFAPDGKLVTWTAEPGGPLEPRVASQDGVGTSGKVTIKAKTSYVTNAGDLIVTYDVRNKSKDSAMVTPKGYVNTDKRQVRIGTLTGSLDVAPGAYATEAATMENGKPGGKMTFTVYFTGVPEPPVSVTVPVSDN